MSSTELRLYLVLLSDEATNALESLDRSREHVGNFKPQLLLLLLRS